MLALFLIIAGVLYHQGSGVGWFIVLMASVILGAGKICQSCIIHHPS